MVQKRWARLWISMTLAGGLLGVATAARAADETARFYGTWKTEFPYYGVMVTMVSVHDSSGYKNYVLVPDGRTPMDRAAVGDGKFSAANGKFTATADKPNNFGTYHFADNNTVVCTNSAGQTVTWKRDLERLPPVVGASAPQYPSHVNATMAAVLAESRRRGVTDAVVTEIELQWYPPRVPDSVKTFRLKFSVYSPSTRIQCMADIGGPNSGNPFCGPPMTGPIDRSLPPLPASFNLDLPDFIAFVRHAGMQGPIQSLQLRMAGATGTPKFPAWVLQIPDGPARVPLFVNAQDGKLASWQRAMDPPSGSDEQLREVYGRVLHPSPPAHGNNGYDALECVVEIQQTGNCAR
jgi:hypothetical protein